MFVIKKDGANQAYDFKKIETAINKSAERVGIELSLKEFESIKEIIGNLTVGRKTIEVYTLHQMVEKTLDIVNPLVARSYRDYRNYKMEYGFQLINEFENKVMETLESVDRENSNSNTRYISTKRTDIAQNFSKEMYQKMFLSVYVLQAIRDGYIYIHDLKDMLLPQYNCLGAETRFVTSAGVKSFKDFKDGETIEVLTPYGNWKKAKVKNYGKQELFKLVFTRSGKSEYMVRATKNHRWLLSDGKFTDNLQVGDSLFNPNNYTVDKSVEEMTQSEKLMWARGFSFGDTTRPNEKNNIKCRLRLCGEKNKYANIFEELGFEKYNFNCKDTWFKVGEDFKEIPKFKNKEDIIAFVIGYLNADGHKSLGNKNSYRGIYCKDEIAQEFIKTMFPVAGVNITKEHDMQGKETNYGIRKGKPKEYSLINAFDKSRPTKLKTIEPDCIEDVWCLEVEDDYSFVLEHGISTGNCCLTDVKAILNGGFEMENVWYNEPKDIRTAIGQVGDIIMVISAQHYGGNTTPQIDKILAPYYRKTIEKYFNRNLERGMSFENASKYANEDAYNDLKQSLQGLEVMLNTVVSARGSYPFTTFTFGDVADNYEADIAKAILEVRMEGHGKKGKRKTMIFPKLVFLHEKSIHGKEKEFEWLFELSVKCSSKCMYPDYIGEAHKREGKWVSPMGCRAYLSNYRDPETNELVFDGRFNIGAVSLNLPMIYKKAKDEQLDFYEVLEHYLQMIRKIHVNRYEYLSKAKASSNPLMFCQGGAYGGNLKPDDRIAPLLKHATASFGITALNELQVLHNGKRLAEDQKFANEVMDYINERVDAFKEEDGNLYAIYNTPAESLCGTQVNQFRNKYGVIEGVSDKDYFTNSNHMWVGEHLTPFEKQDKEIELFKKSAGGHIGYVRINNPGNLTALKAVIERGLELGFYQGVNFNACHCEKCGHHGNDFGDECPICGSKEIDEQNRTCGYLGFSRRRGDHTFNAAKMAEIKQRVSM